MDDPLRDPRVPPDGRDLPLQATPVQDARARAVLRRLRPSPFTLGGGCRWIDGDTRAPDGPRFCAATRERGRPYCHAHCLRAYAGLQRISAETMQAALSADSTVMVVATDARDGDAAGQEEPPWSDR